MNIIVKPVENPNTELTFYKYAWVIYACWLLFGLGHLLLVNDKHVPVKIYMPLLLLAKSLFNLYVYKKKDQSLIIDETSVTGVFEGYESQKKVDWKEIRSVRFEASFIIFYLASSISRAIELEKFEENDQKVIINEIWKSVRERNIEFFNASPAALD